MWQCYGDYLDMVYQVDFWFQWYDGWISWSMEWVYVCVKWDIYYLDSYMCMDRIQCIWEWLYKKVI